MSRGPNFIDTHHICPKSRGGTGRSDNLIELRRSVHEGIHQVFGNELPQEQLKTWIHIMGTALTDEFKGRVLEILKQKDSSYYLKNGVWRKTW